MDVAWQARHRRDRTPQRARFPTSGLDAVVAVRVAEELFEARAVQELLNEHLARGVLGDADALWARL